MIRRNLTLLILALFPSILMAKNFNVAQMGAVSDGKTLVTEIIQSAINQCSATGGGVVLLDGGGEYLSGTLYMKDDVTLRIDGGTTLLASKDIKNFGSDTHKNMYRNEPHMDKAFIFARNAKNFGFDGNGTIDGNGKYFTKETGGRPMMLRFVDCANIRMNNIRLLNPAAWTTAWLYCDDISISGITIISRANGNGDGLDFDGCTNVRVSNSNFDNSDDCICLQTSKVEKPCKFVTISNCTFTTKWGGIRIGLLSRSEISSVTVTNCTFRNINDSGLKIQQNEGGLMKNMTFSNLVMENVPRPVFMTFCQVRACCDVPVGVVEPLQTMSDFNFSNIIVDNTKLDENSLFLFTGMPDHLINNISLSNITLKVAGGGTEEQAKRTSIPDYTAQILNNKWPEYTKLKGVLPCSALFVRHVKNFYVDNFSVQLSKPDARELIYTKNTPNIQIKNLREIK